MQPKVGYLICTCGGQISEKIDINTLSQKTSDLDCINNFKVVDNLCKDTSQLKDALEGCDRLLLAGCSERSSLTLNEDRIEDTMEEAGLNRAMYEVANIREQCAWVNGNTEKAIDMVKMAHTKLLTNSPTSAPQITEKSLVIGGGPAGMQAAIDIAKLGMPVTLVESNAYLGGHTCQIPFLFQCEGWPSMCTSKCVVPVQARDTLFTQNVNVLTSSQIDDIVKEKGNFKVKINKDAPLVDPDKCISCGECAEVCPEEVENKYDCNMTPRKAIDKDFPLAMPDTYNIVEEACTKCGECVEICPTDAIDLDARPQEVEDTFGSVILATGFESYDLNQLEDLNYGDNVISSMEMERYIDNGFQENPEHVVFALCTGSRAEEGEEGMPYCSKTCCGVAVKQIKRLMGMSPETEITVIYNNDIRTYERALEQFYQEARELVDFVNGRISEVEKNGQLNIIVESPEGDEEELEADMVVLAEAQLPGGVDIINKLGLRTDKYGFPMEFQPRIFKPTESYVDRVYVAGASAGPKVVQQSVEQGSTAALRAIQNTHKKAQKFISTVDEQKCSACGLCEKVCPHAAITVNGEALAQVDPAFCQGCGLCMSACPTHALQLTNFQDKQILDQVDVGFDHVGDEPRILALLCYWCSYAAGDMAGYDRLDLPQNVRTMRIRCSSSINSGIIMELFARGVDGIIVSGCPPNSCHHAIGNYMMDKRVKMMSDLMKQLGLSQDRLKWDYVGVVGHHKLKKYIDDMNQNLKELGPIHKRG